MVQSAAFGSSLHFFLKNSHKSFVDKNVLFKIT